MKQFLLWIGMPLALALFVLNCFAALSGSMTEKAIAERIKPIGEVTITGGGTERGQATEAKAKAAPADIGKHRYEETCQMCHATGLADAPKLGDKKAWGPRIAQGMDTMLKHAMEGLRAMPPKGGCTTCDEEEIRKAIEYMVSQSK